MNCPAIPESRVAIMLLLYSCGAGGWIYKRAKCICVFQGKLEAIHVR